jgi:hypothetical protein
MVAGAGFEPATSGLPVRLSQLGVFPAKSRRYVTWKSGATS